jgi:hypothetical protein
MIYIIKEKNIFIFFGVFLIKTIFSLVEKFRFIDKNLDL